MRSLKTALATIKVSLLPQKSRGFRIPSHIWATRVGKKLGDFSFGRVESHRLYQGSSSRWKGWSCTNESLTSSKIDSASWSNNHDFVRQCVSMYHAMACFTSCLLYGNHRLMLSYWQSPNRSMLRVSFKRGTGKRRSPISIQSLPITLKISFTQWTAWQKWNAHSPSPHYNSQWLNTLSDVHHAANQIFLAWNCTATWSLPFHFWQQY